jgi:hypothetical protein
MSLRRWQWLLGSILIGSSVLIYVLQILIFRRPIETEFYLFQDLAFVPVQVLLVSLILNSIFARREKEALLRKLNMVIGVFFTELGTPLLRLFAQLDANAGELRACTIFRLDTSPTAFAEAQAHIQAHKFALAMTGADRERTKRLLHEKRGFLLLLLENPNLLEHESFTDLLWAVSHLAEELEFRPDVQTLPPVDAAHITGDLQRAYSLLLIEWLGYLRHLRAEYPYIFSLAVRMNPLDPEASPTVTG